jgi:hypothetical protein
MKILLAALLLFLTPIAASAHTSVGYVYGSGYTASPFGYAACIASHDSFTERWSNFVTERDNSFYVYCY